MPDKNEQNNEEVLNKENQQPDVKKKKTEKEKPAEVNDKLLKELNEEKEKYLRIVAEYDNFRKRSQKEKESIYPLAVFETVKAFLPLADNFERALGANTEDAEYKKGMELTYKSLQDIFTALGVEVFGSEGEEFDPNIHNAVMHDEDESQRKNEISEVFQKGYKIGDRILRFAMVKVVN